MSVRRRSHLRILLWNPESAHTKGSILDISKWVADLCIFALDSENVYSDILLSSYVSLSLRVHYQSLLLTI